MRVALEDLVLGEVLLQGDGVLELLELSCVALGRGGQGTGPVVVAQGVLLQRDLDVLLGQGGCALDVAAAEVGDERAPNTVEVHAAVLVETAVLDRELGLAHDRRDLGQRHDDAVLVKRGGDHRAVAGQDAGLLRQRRPGEFTRQVVEDVDPLSGCGTGGPGDGHHQARTQQAEHHRRRQEGSQQADDVGVGSNAPCHGSSVGRAGQPRARFAPTCRQARSEQRRSRAGDLQEYKDGYSPLHRILVLGTITVVIRSAVTEAGRYDCWTRGLVSLAKGDPCAFRSTVLLIDSLFSIWCQSPRQSERPVEESGCLGHH